MTTDRKSFSSLERFNGAAAWPTPRPSNKLRSARPRGREHNEMPEVRR